MVANVDPEAPRMEKAESRSLVLDPSLTIPDSRAWHITKLVLRTLSVATCISLIIVSRVEHGNMVSIDWLVSCPPAAVAAVWDLANMVSVRLRRGRKIPPVANLTLELLIWLGSLASLIVLAYTIAVHTKDYYNSEYYEETVKMESGLVALMPCLMTVHFTLSIRYYVEIRRRNQARAMAAQHSGGQEYLQVAEVSADHARMPSELAVPLAARVTELDAEMCRSCPGQRSSVEAPTESQPSASTAGETEETLMARHVELEGKRQRLLQLRQVEEEQEAIRQRLSAFQQGRASARRHEMP